MSVEKVQATPIVLADIRDLSLKPRDERRGREAWGEGESVGSGTEIERREFWGDQPPDEFIIATSSPRKQLMAPNLLNGLGFPGGETGNVLETQAYFKKNIGNKDGSANGAGSERRLIGYVFGVAMYVQATGGEEEDNSHPAQQAVNKAMHLAQEYQGQNVFIVATDMVTMINRNEAGLGKPVNEPNYPRREEFADGEAGAEAFERACDDYHRQYRDSFFSTGSVVTNINGICAYDVLRDKVVVDEKKDDGTVNPDGIIIDPESGGGGVAQQLIDWERFDQADPAGRRQMWERFCELNGMPFVSLLEKAQQLAIMRQESDR